MLEIFISEALLVEVYNQSTSWLRIQAVINIYYNDYIQHIRSVHHLPDSGFV